jgi:GNAT superfamily N-acetyltransferase
MIESVDLQDEAALAEWFEPVRAADLADWPDGSGWALRELAVLIRDRTASTSELAVVRGDDGDVEASAWVRMPERENRQVAEVRLVVHPRWRGRGSGRALLDHCEQMVRSRDRHTIVATTDEPVREAEASASARFARAAGYEPALAEARRSLALPVDPAFLDRLEAACLCFSSAYELVAWIGACPDGYLDGRVALARSISTDAPQGKLAKEADDVDADRIRTFEKAIDAMDRDEYSAGAVETSTGELVGFTEIGVPRTLPKHAYQFDTVVLHAHRGHRLGTLLKIANLRALAERSPATEYVLTWNAIENDPMIRVNDMLGFEVVGLGTAWQKDLP